MLYIVILIFSFLELHACSFIYKIGTRQSHNKFTKEAKPIPYFCCKTRKIEENDFWLFKAQNIKQSMDCTQKFSMAQHNSLLEK